MSRELKTSRLLQASPAAAFDAFRNPERLARWWGPADFTNTFNEFAFEPGGWWRFVMHGPNGANFTNESVFVEIVEAERIVFKHESGPKYEMTITLAEEGGGTRLTWRMLFPTEKDCDKVRPFAEPANEQNLDRLEAELKRPR